MKVGDLVFHKKFPDILGVIYERVTEGTRKGGFYVRWLVDPNAPMLSHHYSKMKIPYKAEELEVIDASG